jgi:hypothetical protein
MARTKFTFEKRQKELAKRQKREEKVVRRTEAKLQKSGTDPEQQDTPDATDRGSDAEAPAGVDGNGGSAQKDPQ